MPHPAYTPMRSGSAVPAAPASVMARSAAATANWLTRSTPASLVNQRSGSKATVAAAAGFGNSGNTGATADSAAIKRSKSAST